MKSTLGCPVRGRRLFGTVKRSQINGLAVDFDLSLPTRRGPRWRDPSKPRGVASQGSRDVLHVLGACDVAQVDNPIVVLHFVPVVDLSGWPRPIDVQPGQLVGQIPLPAEPDPSVAVGHDTASNSSDTNTVARPDLPSEHTSGPVVVERFPQLFCRQNTIHNQFYHIPKLKGTNMKGTTSR